MSDIVNDQNNDQESGALAAEFVLGTLDSDERARANELLDSDPHFRGMVRVWERRLGELHLMVEPVEPPAPIWDRIKSKLESIEQDAAVGQQGMEVSQQDAAVSQQDNELGQPEVPAAADTIATLEALEAELREEGLAPPAAPVIDLMAPAMEPPPLAAMPEPDGEAGPERQDRVAAPASPAPVRSWGLLAILMTLVAMALGGLIAAWRYFPERLPPQLRAVQVLNIRLPEPPPPPPVRPSAPPGSRFDE